MPKTWPGHNIPLALPALVSSHIFASSPDKLNLLPILVDHLRDSEEKVDDDPPCQFEELAPLSSDELGNKTRPENNKDTGSSRDPENNNPIHSDANLNLQTQPNQTREPEPDTSLDIPSNPTIQPNHTTDLHDNQFAYTELQDAPQISHGRVIISACCITKM